MNRTGKNTFDKENNHKYLNKKGESQSKRASLIKQSLPEEPNYKLRNSEEIKRPTINVVSVTESLASCPQIQIFAEPRTNTQQYLHEYSQELLDRSAKNGQLMGNFLLNHDIDNQLRARMLDWLIEVCTSYKFQAKTYFSSVNLMDQYFKKEDSRLPISKLHITGVTAMLIATKMDEVYPLKIKTVYQKIVHKKIEKRELIDMQARIFNKLNNCVNVWSFFDLALLKLHCIRPSRAQKTLQDIQLLCEHIAKFMVFSYQLMGQYSIQILADSLLLIACEAYKRENSQSFLGVKQLKLANEKCAPCIDLIIQTIKSYKSNFANLKNIFRFGDFSIHKQIEYFLEGQ